MDRSPTLATLSLVVASLVLSVEAEVTWLHPSDGQNFPLGQSIQASWSSDSPVVSPSFRLCSSTESCGTAIWPTITKDDSGNSHISLTAPPMDSDTTFFLTMRGDDMVTYESPSFVLLAGAEATTLDEPAPEETTEDVPSSTEMEDPMDTSTPSLPETTDPFGEPIEPLPTSSSDASDLLLLPSSISALSSQSISTSTSTSSPLITSLTPPPPPPLVKSDAASSPPNKPNVKAIGFPLLALALISLGALIFLLRRKPTEPPAAAVAPVILDLEKAVGSLEEKPASMSSEGRSEFGGRGESNYGAAALATLDKDYPSTRRGSQDDSYHQDGYTSPPRRGSRVALAPSRSESTIHRQASPPSRRPSSNPSLTPSYRHLSAPRNEIYSPSLYPSHNSTPAFRPSPRSHSSSNSPEDQDILSFPWSHTPYTPSLSPPYLPQLRGVPGRAGMGVDRERSRGGKSTLGVVGRGRREPTGSSSIYSDAEELVGRETARRRDVEKRERDMASRKRDQQIERERERERERDRQRDREDRERQRLRERERLARERQRDEERERARGGERAMDDLYNVLNQSLHPR